MQLPTAGSQRTQVFGRLTSFSAHRPTTTTTITVLRASLATQADHPILSSIPAQQTKMLDFVCSCSPPNAPAPDASLPTPPPPFVVFSAAIKPLPDATASSSHSVRFASARRLPSLRLRCKPTNGPALKLRKMEKKSKVNLHSQPESPRYSPCLPTTPCLVCALPLSPAGGSTN